MLYSRSPTPRLQLRIEPIEERLIQGAALVASLRGIDQIDERAVCRWALLTPDAFGHYFASVEAALLAGFERHVDDLATAMSWASASADGPLDKAREALSELIAFLAQHPREAHLWWSELARHAPRQWQAIAHAALLGRLGIADADSPPALTAKRALRATHAAVAARLERGRDLDGTLPALMLAAGPIVRQSPATRHASGP